MKRTRVEASRPSKRYRYNTYQPRRSARSYRPAGEPKYFDQEVDDFALPGNGAWAGTNDALKGTICIPQEGSDIDDRIGRKIAVHKIAVRGVIKYNADTDQVDIVTSPAIRILLWMDQQCNGTVTTAASLMQAPQNAEADNVFCTFQNPSNFGRFRMLRDKIFFGRDNVAGTDGANTTSQCPGTIPFKMTVKFKKPIIVKFNSTNGGTIADIVDNAFYLSCQASGGAFTKTLTARTRVYYRDY